jgi:hypothetical protein
LYCFVFDCGGGPATMLAAALHTAASQHTRRAAPLCASATHTQLTDLLTTNTTTQAQNTPSSISWSGSSKGSWLSCFKDTAYLLLLLVLLLVLVLAAAWLNARESSSDVEDACRQLFCRAIDALTRAGSMVLGWL